MSKLTMKLSEESKNKMRERIANGDVMIIPGHRVTEFSKKLKLPLYFERDCILNYPDFKRDNGYTTGLIKLAYHHDCVIVCPTNVAMYEFERKLLDYAAEQINPNCFQKFLIKLGF